MHMATQAGAGRYRLGASARSAGCAALPGGFDDRPQLLAVRRVGCEAELGAGLDRVEGLVEPVAVGAQLAQAWAAGRARRSAREASPDRCRSASARAAICSGARSRMKAIAWGRIAALVSACGIPSVRTSVWQITWWIANSAESIA